MWVELAHSRMEQPLCLLALSRCAFFWGVMEFDRTRGFLGEGLRAGRQQRLPLQQRPDIRLDQGRFVSSKTRSRRDLSMHSF